MPLRRAKNMILMFVALLAASIAFAGWYRVHYSMSVAQSLEVNDPHALPRVLIATQGSKFKDAVVAGLIEHLASRAAYVKVIDVSALPGVNDADWNAIVLVHTWEMREPPAEVRDFVGRVREARKVIALTTSGGGEFKLDGIDAISSASSIEDVPARVADLVKNLDAVLGQG